jgi:CheY-like chemotaxis protein
MKCAVKLLLVEDNRRLQHTLRRSLVEAGYAVDVADDAEDGQALAEVTAYDVVVLDVMLPRGDGLQVCRELRRQGVPTPILMLTARDAVEDRVRGLDCGADDYLVKPFALGGDGLGLAIARWVAVAHGGDIEARNRLTGGASFEIVLPRAQSH